MFERLLEVLAKSLEQNHIEYLIVGGQAVLIYGEPRLTRDIDVTLGVGTERLPDIRRIAQDLRWEILTDSPESFVKETMVLPCLDPESEIRIDFIFSFSEYERQAMERAKQVKIGQTQDRFASVEDLLIHKVVAGRPRDLEDARTVVLKNPKIDVSYIEKWLRQFEKSMSQPLLQGFRDLVR